MLLSHLSVYLFIRTCTFRMSHTTAFIANVNIKWLLLKNYKKTSYKASAFQSTNLISLQNTLLFIFKRVQIYILNHS